MTSDQATSEQREQRDQWREQRLVYLDSLRGLAAVAVFCRHFTGAFGDFGFLPRFVDASPLAAYRDGAAAISMFFVLSGFLLSVKVLAAGATGYDLRRNLLPFAGARIARIWLPFVAILVLSAIAQRTLMPVAGGDSPPSSIWLLSFWRTPAPLADLVQQGMLVFMTKGDHVLPQDWTLTVELHLSLLMPFLLLISTQSMAALAAFTVLAVGLLKVHNFLVGFVLGMFVARFSRPLVAALRRAPAAALALVTLAGVFLYSFRYSRAMLPPLDALPIRESFLVHINELGAATILVAVLASPRLQRILEHALPTFVGRVSYSLYLLQIPVLILFTPVFIRWLNTAGLRDADFVRVLAWLASMIVLLVLSRVSFAVFEAPGIALGRWMRGRGRRGSHAATEVPVEIAARAS